MCDVDQEAVVTAADAPSIYDIPKVLHREGLDAYLVRRLDLPFRDVDWTRLGRPAPPGPPPEGGGHRRAGRQVRRPARRLPLGRRGAARRRLRPRGQGAPALGRLRRVPDPGGRREAAAGRRRGLRPGRLRRPRHRGQARRADLRPHPRHPDARPVPGPAVHGDRVLPLGARPGEGRLDRVRPGHPGAGDRDDGRAGRVRRGRRRPGRHDAPGPLPGRAQGGLDRPRGVRRGADRRAAPAPLRGQQRLPRPARRRPACVFSGTSPDDSLVEFVELPARRAPLLRRHPGAPRAALPARPGRTRCSRAWSARRSSGRRSCGSRSTRPGCAASPRTTSSGPFADGGRRLGDSLTGC